MSVPELPYSVSDGLIDCLKKTTKICLDLKEINQRNTKIVDDLRDHLRLGLNKPTSRKTVASSDMDPDPSSGINYGGVIAQGFRGLFLLNSSCHDFEKVYKGQKMSSQLWIHMAGYRNYLLYTYVFISSFVSVTKYAGRKMKQKKR